MPGTARREYLSVWCTALGLTRHTAWGRTEGKNRSRRWRGRGDEEENNAAVYWSHEGQKRGRRSGMHRLRREPPGGGYGTGAFPDVSGRRGKGRLLLQYNLNRARQAQALMF